MAKGGFVMEMLASKHATTDKFPLEISILHVCRFPASRSIFHAIPGCMSSGCKQPTGPSGSLNA